MPMSQSVIRMWWGERNRDDHRAKNRQMMETTLRCVMNDKYQVDFVTYVCGKDNYDYLKSEGLENISLVTKEPRLDIPVEWDAQHRLHLCDYAMGDFREIICLNWDCRLIRPFTNDVWLGLQQKEPIQAALIANSHRRQFLKNRGDDAHIFCIDGFLYLRDYTLPSKILKLLDDPSVNHKWSGEFLISAYIDRLHGRWIGLDKYFELYEPECFYPGRLGIWKKSRRSSCYFAWNKKFKTKVDIT